MDYYLFGYLGVLVHLIVKFAPTLEETLLRKMNKPPRYKILVAVLGSLLAIISYTILYYAAHEGSLQFGGFTVEINALTSPALGYSGSSLFQNIAAKIFRNNDRRI